MFLTTDSFIIPNIAESRLDIFKLAGSSTHSEVLDDSEPAINNLVLVVSLGLPPLTPLSFIQTISCRAEPNPHHSFFHHSATQKRKAAHFAPDTAILTFNVNASGPARMQLDTFTFVCHRSAIIKFLPEEVDAPPRHITWDAWGPTATRCFGPTDFSVRWITTTAGQRMASMKRLTSSMFCVLIHDFNPLRIRRALADQENNPSKRVRIVRGPSQLVDDNKVFLHKIYSDLEYMEIMAKEWYDIAAVLLEDESLVGLMVCQISSKIDRMMLLIPL